MSEISGKSSEPKFMNALAEASFRIRRLAEPAPVGDSVKAAIRRAGTALDAWCRSNGFEPWTRNRIKDVFTAEPRVSVSADELEQLRAAQAARKKTDENARAEVRQIMDGIAALVARLGQIDEGFHSEAIAALRAASHPDRQ